MKCLAVSKNTRTNTMSTYLLEYYCFYLLVTSYLTKPTSDCYISSCNVPGNFTEDQTLARFVKRQKKAYKGMEADTENEKFGKRITALNSVGFEDCIPVGGCSEASDKLRRQKWDAMLARLQRYKDEHGE